MKKKKPKLPFNKLQPGMLIKDVGLIVHAGAAGTDKFYGDSQFLKFFCIEDSYHGMVLRSVKLTEEFEEEFKVGSSPYKETVKKILFDRLKAGADVERDVDLLRLFMRLG